MNRTELLTKIRAARNRLEAALAGLSDAELEAPLLPNGWTGKDLYGHIGFWEAHNARILSALQRGALPDPDYEGVPDDEVNALAEQEYRQFSLMQVRRNERIAYNSLLSMVEGAPEADLFDPHRFAWTKGLPFWGWIAGPTYEHYEEHLLDLPSHIP
jgi:hypothetical protein